MEKFIEKTGRTTDDAIAAALAELHLERTQFISEVLEVTQGLSRRQCGPTVASKPGSHWFF